MNKISVGKSYEKEEGVDGLQRFGKPERYHGARARQLRFSLPESIGIRISVGTVCEDRLGRSL